MGHFTQILVVSSTISYQEIGTGLISWKLQEKVLQSNQLFYPIFGSKAVQLCILRSPTNVLKIFVDDRVL